MLDSATFQHLGGGRKGLFLLLRYVFIISASYLLLFGTPGPVAPIIGFMIAVALASNVVLSAMPVRLVFSWYVEAPILVADTLWVSWALHATGSRGQEFFLLYFFVLSLAVLGENLVLVVVGSTIASLANMFWESSGSLLNESQLLRVVFFYTVALFYGYVINQIKHERQRADKGFAWARELEARVAERTAELSRLYSAAQAASRLKSEFMAMISHELRTPLHIIIGYAELLLDGDSELPEEERRRMLRRIYEAAGAQTHLVESVLDLGRAEAGKLPVDRQPLRLERFLDEFRNRPRLPLSPRVDLAWKIAPDLPVIETDPGKLRTILENLLNNAIKFTAEGTIRVRVDDVPARDCIELRVEDTGPGIAEEFLPAIFEPFRQLDGAPTRRYGGAGLGLAIAHRYVELLGATIEVHSRIGVGTTFVVCLPYGTRQKRDERGVGSANGAAASEMNASVA
jgi:signal transduction histidine kinase